MGTNRKVVIYGGGSLAHISNHLALCAPSYGATARTLKRMFEEHPDFRMEVDLRLTKMAGGDTLETNDDVRADVVRAVADPLTQIMVLNAAICDFIPEQVTGAGGHP